MKKPILATTGLDGLIGNQIAPILSQYYDLLPLSQKEIDIRNKDIVNRVIKKLDFDYFLHLAAYTNVDANESNQKEAHEINVKGTSFLFSSVKNRKKPFFYISTDFVFDGKNPPFTEKSIPNPVNYYGKTKLLGEKIIGSNGIIIRLSYPFGKKYSVKKDIVHTIVDLLKTNKFIHAIHDNLITPTYIKDIAQNLHILIQKKTNGIYHISGKESISSFELFRKIAKILKIKTSIIPIDFRTYYKNKVLRPQYAQITTIHNKLFTYTPLDEALRNALAEE